LYLPAEHPYIYTPFYNLYQDIPVYSTNKNDCHDIAEILLKVAFDTTSLTLYLTEYLSEDTDCIGSWKLIRYNKTFISIKLLKIF
jgi:hypothetical protein